MRTIVIAICTQLLLFSCNPPSSIGSSFLPTSSFEVLTDESIELSASTIAIEEVPAQNAVRLLAGDSQNDLTGQLRAQSYVSLFPEEGSFFDEDLNYDYDSIALTLTYDGYYEGDTTQAVILEIYRVAEPLEPDVDNDEFEFYTNDTLNVDLLPLAAQEVSLEPRSRQSISIKISDQLGQQFFNKILMEDIEMVDDEEFTEYFPGVRISLRSGSNVIVGFSPEISLDLHYSNTSALPIEAEVRSFKPSFNARFNQVVTDRSSTPIADLPVDENLPVVETDGIALIQGGSALATRIDLDDWLQQRERFSDAIIRTATLIVEPAVIMNLDGLTPTIDLYWIDRNNEITFLDQPGRLVEEEFGRSTTYHFDLLNFVEFQLLPEALEETAIMLTFDLEGGSASTLFLEGQDDIKLNISYITINLNN